MLQILIKNVIQISTVRYFCVSYRLLKLKDRMKSRYITSDSRINILHFSSQGKSNIKKTRYKRKMYIKQGIKAQHLQQRKDCYRSAMSLKYTRGCNEIEEFIYILGCQCLFISRVQLWGSPLLSNMHETQKKKMFIYYCLDSLNLIPCLNRPEALAWFIWVSSKSQTCQNICLQNVVNTFMLVN